MPTSCLDYTCPIVIPQGLKGDTGASGTSGTNGTTIISNSYDISLASGTYISSNLKIVTIPAASVFAGDVLEAEATFRIAHTTTIVGMLYITLGSTTVGSMTLNTVPAIPDAFPVLSSYCYFKIKSRIMCKTTTSQYVQRENRILGIPTTITELAPMSATENLILPNTIILKVYLTVLSATLTCDNFIVTKYKI